MTDAIGVAFAAALAGVLFLMVLGGPGWALKWVGMAALLLAVLPRILMTLHLACCSTLSEAQKDEWARTGWGLEPCVVAFFYLFRGGTPLVPGNSSRWKRDRQLRRE